MISITLKRYDETLPLLSGGKFSLKAPNNVYEGINAIDYSYHFEIPKGYKLKIESRNSYVWPLGYQFWEKEEQGKMKGGLEILVASRFHLDFIETFDLFEVTLVKSEEKEARFRFIEMNPDGKRVIGGSPSEVFRKVINEDSKK